MPTSRSKIHSDLKSGKCQLLSMIAAKSFSPFANNRSTVEQDSNLLVVDARLEGEAARNVRKNVTWGRTSRNLQPT
jgi:hypothetical protein